MAINVADNFSYQGAKPLDGRLKYDTLAAMKAVADATMYDGCMAYCAGTDKTYQWKSTNTVDESTGKWREFSSGGGTEYTAGDGIDITNDEISIDPMPSEDMDDVIDSLPSGGRIAVTGYVPLGTVIPVFRETAPQFFLICDGSTYNKADYPELAELLLGLTTHSQYEVDGDSTKFKVPDLRGEFLRGTGTNSHANQGSGANVGVHQDGTKNLAPVSIHLEGGSKYIGAQCFDDYYEGHDIQDTDSVITATNNTWMNNAQFDSNSSSGTKFYTARTTNTSVLYCIAYKDIYSNPMNEYSTTEKVVGTWIDGRPVYLRIVHLTNPSVNWTGIAIPDTTDMDICMLKGAYFKANYSGTLPWYVSDSNMGSALMFRGSSDTSYYAYIKMTESTLGTVKDIWLTLQYTKTT